MERPIVGDTVHVVVAISNTKWLCVATIVTEILDDSFNGTMFAPHGSMTDTAKRTNVVFANVNWHVFANVNWHTKEDCPSL